MRKNGLTSNSFQKKRSIPVHHPFFFACTRGLLSCSLLGWILVDFFQLSLTSIDFHGLPPTTRTTFHMDFYDIQKNARAWFDAVESGNEVAVAQLLADMPNLVFCLDDYKATALHVASENGHAKLVAWLLAKEPRLIKQVDGSRSTALHLAATEGYDEVVAELLAAAPPGFIDWIDDDSFTALHCAALFGHANVVARLLATNPESASIITEECSSVLHLVLGPFAQRGKESQVREIVTQLLAVRPSLIDGVNKQGMNVLHLAVQHHSEDICELLLAIKPDLVFAVDARSRSVLRAAILCSDEFVMKLWRMNPEALQASSDCRDGSPLQALVRNDRDSVIDLLQWSLAIDDLVEVFHTNGRKYEDRFRPVLRRQCEFLLEWLNQDVLGEVFEYLGFLSTTKRSSSLLLTMIEPTIADSSLIVHLEQPVQFDTNTHPPPLD